MKKILLLLSLLVLLCYLNYLKKEEIIIPKDAIRFRIIPNSNDIKDLAIKEKVKKALNKTLSIEKKQSLKEAREEINNRKSEVNNEIKNVFKENNYNETYELSYGLNYFPKKKYKGIKYEEGNYESLVVKIGDAKGDNFWCVLYPPLCMMDEKVKNKKEYRLFIKDIFSKYL